MQIAQDFITLSQYQRSAKLGDPVTTGDPSNPYPVTFNNLISTLQDGTTDVSAIVAVILSQGINFTVSAEAEAMIQSVTDSDTAQQVIDALKATFYNNNGQAAANNNVPPAANNNPNKQTAEQWVQKNLFTTTGAISGIGIAALIFAAVMLMQRK